jgi:hypothetical protein
LNEIEKMKSRYYLRQSERCGGGREARKGEAAEEELAVEGDKRKSKRCGGGREE